MAVSHTEAEDQVALIDTVTGTAFGPVFFTPSEADSFLEWLTDQHEEGNAFEVDGETVRFPDDARLLSDKQIEAAVNQFREEQDEDED